MKKMNKALKWTLIIGGVGVTGVVIYFVYKGIKKALDKGNAGDSENKESYANDEQIQNEEYNKVSRDSYPETPFTSKAEGNKFRDWVNDTYPKYAKQIDLDRSGDFNNSYIRKAYAQYGAEYQTKVKQSDISSRASEPLSAEFKALLSTWKKPVYYSKSGNAYFQLKFRKTANALSLNENKCNGIVYVFNTNDNYIKGASNDKRGVLAVYWDGANYGSAYWSNKLKDIEGRSGDLKNVSVKNNSKGLGKFLGANLDIPEFVWC